MSILLTPEHQRLAAHADRSVDWKLWGPYLSERAWGTVREDYSATGEAWTYFPHDHARSRAYRWSEDGLLGICDRRQNLCFALALWNGRDPILKERLFGLAGPEGNHGEDVKEYYYYLDSTPTHSYMKALYKYPQAAFPYAWLVEENRRRNRYAPEFELIDSGVFDEDRYFDVFVEYAKAAPDDVLIRITVVNRRPPPSGNGPDPARLHVLPHLWFRNIWSWGYPWLTKPELHSEGFLPGGVEGPVIVQANSKHLKRQWLYCDVGPDGSPPKLLFTDNESNRERLWGAPNAWPYVKDGVNDAIVSGAPGRVNPELKGTKAAAHYALDLAPGQTQTLRLRLTGRANSQPFQDFEATFALRRKEADEFYATVMPERLSDDERDVMRQAFAGLMWTKQYFGYDVDQWLNGDPAGPPPPSQRKHGRNSEWTHVHTSDILSMPDKWEYPWFAAWDLAFHCVPIALVDPDFAKRQLILMLREWYMHPNGQIPAYEWAFGDVNPPVHAWAAWRVYKIDRNLKGKADSLFLERVFQKLMLNFTWWVNRKDAEGRNIFQGGFLGLDNIGVFDRSAPLPTGGFIEQADGTSWMGMYCLNLLAMAFELARHNPAYEDVATKFFEHFIYIAHAINNLGDDGASLWDEQDGFFYDVLHLPDDTHIPLRTRSFVGLIPLFAVETLEPDLLDKLPRFKRRMQWFLDNRPELTRHIASLTTPGVGGRRLLAIADKAKLDRILPRMLDGSQFLSPYGLRALSKAHEHEPFTFAGNAVRYEPAESTTGLFGGNSNWRGPIWFPTNFLMIESLQKYHHYYGDEYKVECPRYSDHWLTLWEVAAELSRRLTRLFLRDAAHAGRRPVFGGVEKFQSDPHWRDYLLFYEYFHGDNGAGLGASHQTGWTALVAKLIQQSGGAGE
jgi:hypothetical protein